MKISLRSLLLVIAAGIITCSLATAQSLPKRTHGHEVSLDSAKKFIKNLKKDAMQMKLSGGLYFRDVFDKMLSQKGVVALRFYFAKTDDGNPTLVAVGVDSTGKDMTSGVIAESTYPCPPYCESASELLR